MKTMIGMRNWVRTLRIVNILLMAGAVLLAAPAGAARFTFTAEVDKTRLSQDDTLRLSLVISGDNLVTELRPELPEFAQNFEVLRGPNQSTSISIINGNYTSSMTIQYLLTPKTTGTVTIPPATVQHDGQTYKTEPITIEVVQGAQPHSPTMPPKPGSQQGDQGAADDTQPDIFLHTELDKTSAYLGEQITLSYYLYTRVNIAGYEISQQPSFTGFWVENLDVPNPPTLQYQDVNGVRYGVALMKKVALFPTSSGELTIDPMVMTLSVRVQSRSRDPFDRAFDDPFDTFFGRTREILRTTRPLTLTIRPLPQENRPAQFNGNVGSFSMAVDVDTTRVKQDEPLTLTVKIQGSGNIKTVQEPTITLPESFKRYDPEIEEIPFPLQEPLQGEKIFKSVIIPSEPGEFQIEPIQFAYFDPQRQAYQTLRSQPITLTVAPNVAEETPLERRIASKEDIKLLDQDIRFIKTDLPRLHPQNAHWYSGASCYGMLLIPLLAIGAAYGYKRHRDTYLRDERYVRRKQAKKRSRQQLRAARALMRDGAAKDFYAAVSSALHHYLGDKFNLAPAGITVEEIRPLLDEYGADAETSELLRRCLDECDFARFAPVGSNANDMQAMLQQAETVIERLEKLKRGRPSAAARAVLIFALFSLSAFLFSPPCFGQSETAQADSMPREVFQQGNRLYENGEYAQAIDRYQRLLDAGIRSGTVYYNLGNALLKENRIGEAILAYERAHRLLPRDDDVAFNLEYARALTLDKMDSWASGPLARGLTAVRDVLTPLEARIVFSLMYGILTFLAITAMFAPRRWRIRLLYAAVLPALGFLLASAVMGLQLYHARTVDDAILLAPQTIARTGPGESYSTVFELHEGAKVRIQRAKRDWVEIKLPNNVIGWVSQHNLERIEPVS